MNVSANQKKPSCPAALAYDRAAAVDYAHQWAFKRNPAYYDFEGIGGDCTNFASQCLFAGSGVMNYTPVFGWFYINANYKAPAWTGVPYLYNFLTRGECTPGPFGVEAGIGEVQPGDLVQLDFHGDEFGHTPVIVSVGNPPKPENVLIAAHTDDSDYRPVSDYPALYMRFIHILGVHPQK